MWVSNPERLAREDIPKYYPHSSYASWTRALHAHQFRKLTPSTWRHPDFHRDRPEAAATIARRRPNRPSKQAAGTLESLRPSEADDVLALGPLVPQHDDEAGSAAEGSADASGEEEQAASEGGRDVKAAEQPSPVVAARLAALREQIVRERAAMQQLKGVIERLEAHVTRARREELQLRSQVVQLASWVATAFAKEGMKLPMNSLAATAQLAESMPPMKPAIEPAPPLLICSAAS